jgi:UDP-N-acetylglucosamine--N-acetylmuramyl-(pentapeptide) pyrophosphoryl-undecaprenol N-acetylglucosamine transferase
MRVIIAGGGTGGHLFPGIAIAEALRLRDPGNQILFLGTSNPIEVSTLSEKGFDHESIVAEGLKGRGIWRQIRSLFKIPVGMWQASRIMWRFHPDIIVGLGAYASGPVALAAWLAGKKLVIHEQNILPGLTNQVLGRLAHRILISFPDTGGVFPPSRTVITGNPLRRELLESRLDKKANGAFTVLVVGGSQGAHAVNRAVIESLDHLESPTRMTFIHQTGRKDAAWVAQAYESRNVTATVKPFFVDMASPYHLADLVVCRAGATTVSELMALGKPAIFIPFPFAANNHQELNARHVANAGGGEIILEKDMNGAVLAGRLDQHASNPKALQDMAERMLALARPNAADVIVDECQRLVIEN